MNDAGTDADLPWLQQTGHLLDFDYRDEDVDTLCQLIKPQASVASPLTDTGASPGMYVTLHLPAPYPSICSSPRGKHAHRRLLRTTIFLCPPVDIWPLTPFGFRLLRGHEQNALIRTIS